MLIFQCKNTWGYFFQGLSTAKNVTQPFGLHLSMSCYSLLPKWKLKTKLLPLVWRSVMCFLQVWSMTEGSLSPLLQQSWTPWLSSSDREGGCPSASWLRPATLWSTWRPRAAALPDGHKGGKTHRGQMKCVTTLPHSIKPESKWTDWPSSRARTAVTFPV